MRVPIRKPGKFTHDKLDPHMTRAKYNELIAKLEKLKKTRPKASAEVQRLAQLGDFSDNAAYSMAKGRLRGINQRIIELEDHLGKAQIIKTPTTDFIGLGNVVTIETNGRNRSFQILGSSEANPSTGTISHNSPIGKALLGHKKGDVINIKLKEKTITYKIIEIK